MELDRAILERRSIRHFTDQPVSEQHVSIIMEAGRWAPSWANTQCCRFVVVRDPAIRESLAATLTSTNRALDSVRKAPVIIAVCAELGKSGFRQGQISTDKGDWFMFDSGLAVQNIVLTAHSLGLGTVIVALLDARKAAQVLKLPDNMAFVALMPLGHPDHVPTAPPRKQHSELVHYDYYGNTAV